MAIKDTGGKSDNAHTTDSLCLHYEEMIDRYDRVFEPWHVRARKICDIYTEKRKGSGVNRKRMSLLYANINVLQPAVYSRMPLPTVSRRFRDPDPVARQASELIQRCLHYSFDTGDADGVLRKVRDDFLLVGRGTAWVRYEADIEQEGSPDDDGDAEDTTAEAIEPTETISDERVVWEYVHWEDFGHNVCRHWAEVTAVWRKSYLTRKELRERFAETLSPDEINAIPLDFKPKEKAAQSEAKSQAIVYEIWCKRSKRVIWLVKGFHKPLEVSAPPLQFDGFFPCPKPAYATLETASLVPVPDYVYYQDQAEEIDDLTARIASLTDSVKLVGFYPGDMEGNGQSAIEKAAQPGYENKLIAVSNWAAFADKGAGGAAFVWWPADMVAKTIDQCIQIRKQLVDDVYQITGISDIVRGDSAASETATAQQIKTQWGSMRIRDRQIALATVARDMARLGGEIIAEQFSPETLLRMSNMKLPSRAEVQQMIMQAARAQAPAQAQQPQRAPAPALGGSV